MRLPVLLLAATAVLEMGQAGAPPPRGDTDVQSVAYAPDRIVTIQAAIGYAVVVELAADDWVENVVVGSSGTWQVTTNQRGNHLIIKPSPGAIETDLVVTTGTRRYIFLLEPASSPGTAPFVVRFDYPAAARTAQNGAAAPVAGYKLQGDKTLFPTAIGDDGHRTTITWGATTPLPAVLAVDARGNEAIVNGRMVDERYVIEGVAPRYVFRLGKAEADATRRPIVAEQR